MKENPIKIEITVLAASEQEAANIQNKLQAVATDLGRLGVIGLLESTDQYLSKAAKVALKGSAILYKLKPYVQ